MVYAISEKVRFLHPFFINSGDKGGEGYLSKVISVYDSVTANASPTGT